MIYVYSSKILACWQAAGIVWGWKYSALYLNASMRVFTGLTALHCNIWIITVTYANQFLAVRCDQFFILSNSLPSWGKKISDRQEGNNALPFLNNAQLISGAVSNMLLSIKLRSYSEDVSPTLSGETLGIMKQKNVGLLGAVQGTAWMGKHWAAQQGCRAPGWA